MARGSIFLRFWPTAWFLIAPALASANALTRAELADKLKTYGSFSSLDVDFHQIKTLSEMGVRIESEGRLSLTRPSRIRWEITKPSPVVVKLDEHEIRIEIGKGKDLQIQTLKRQAPVAGQSTGQSPGPSSDPMDRGLSELVSWLNMDVAALDRQYAVYSDGASAFRFEPRQKETSVFKALRMELAAQGYLKKLRIEELSGDLLEIDFGKPHLGGTKGSPAR